MSTSNDYERSAGVSAPVQLLMDRDVQAPAIARAAVADMCDEHQVDGRVRQTVVLLVSEVVSNAILHSSGPSDAPVTLTAQVSPEAVTVAVTDAGEGFTPGRRDPGRVEGGYGLLLLEKAASRWGVDDSAPTTVWFEVALTP